MLLPTSHALRAQRLHALRNLPCLLTHRSLTLLEYMVQRRSEVLDSAIRVQSSAAPPGELDGFAERGSPRENSGVEELEPLRRRVARFSSCMRPMPAWLLASASAPVAVAPHKLEVQSAPVPASPAGGETLRPSMAAQAASRQLPPTQTLKPCGVLASCYRGAHPEKPTPGRSAQGPCRCAPQSQC